MTSDAPTISRRSLVRMAAAAAGCALGRPSPAQPAAKRMLALIGDRYHNADYIRVALDKILDGLNLKVDYTTNYDQLSRTLLGQLERISPIPRRRNRYESNQNRRLIRRHAEDVVEC